MNLLLFCFLTDCLALQIANLAHSGLFFLELLLESTHLALELILEVICLVVYLTEAKGVLVLHKLAQQRNVLILKLLNHLHC